MGRIAISVTGMSGSGKTTLAEVLAERLDATLIRVDDYYRSFSHLDFDARCDLNFDHPQTVDGDRLANDLEALLRGEEVDIPDYDFCVHAPREHPKPTEPRSVIIVEGIFAMAYPRLVNLCEIRVFVETNEQACLERRLERDVVERGRTPGEVIGRFESHVAPMFRQFGQPTRDLATVVVSGENDLEHAVKQVLCSVPVAVA